MLYFALTFVAIGIAFCAYFTWGFLSEAFNKQNGDTRFYFAFFGVLGLWFIISIVATIYQDYKEHHTEEPTSLYSAPSQGGMVYVCTGPNSERYHKSSDCTGLSRCSDEIEAYSREEARSLGYTPCGICYR